MQGVLRRYCCGKSCKGAAAVAKTKREAETSNYGTEAPEKRPAAARWASGGKTLASSLRPAGRIRP